MKLSKEYIFYAMLLAIIGLSILEAVDFDSEVTFYNDMRAHHDGADAVYSQLIEFMSRGDRFTAEEGKEMDARIKALEKAVFEETDNE